MYVACSLCAALVACSLCLLRSLGSDALRQQQQQDDLTAKRGGAQGDDLGSDLPPGRAVDNCALGGKWNLVFSVSDIVLKGRHLLSINF